METMRAVLLFPAVWLLVAPAAARPMSGPGGPGPFLATRGDAAARKTAAPARPARPAARPMPEPRVGPPLYSPYGPRLTGWSTDSRGRVNGYRVVLPAVEENPFAGMPPATAPVAGWTPPPPRVGRVVTERVYELRPPISGSEAEEAEEAALAEKVGGGTPVPKKVDEARFRSDVLPAVRTNYRMKGAALVPAFSWEVSGTAVHKTARPEAAPLPQPDVERIMAAFEAGAAFVVPRKTSFAVPCGACAGTGLVAVRRIVRDDGSADRLEYGACARCGGAGTRTLEATRLYEVSKAP